MKIKSFWPDWLQDAVGGYKFGKKIDRMETLNDIHDLNLLTEEDCKLCDQVYEAMGTVYDDKPHDYLTQEQRSYLWITPEQMKNRHLDRRPHISTFLAPIEPFKSFHSKYPALYKTMVVWMWG